MEIRFVRLKPYDPRRGHVLQRYTYRGIKFQADRGWYRVEKDVADYLRDVRQVATDEHSPAAFDVCTEEEARAIDKQEKAAENKRKSATDNIKLSRTRDGALTTDDLSESDSKSASSRRNQKK